MRAGIRNRPTIAASVLLLLTMLTATDAGSGHGEACCSRGNRTEISTATRQRAEVELETILGLIGEHRRSARFAWRRRLADAIWQESVSVGVDPLLVAAVAARESSFRTRVVSRAGAVGLMQLRPFVARELARKQALEWRGGETLHAPETNVRLGAAYLRQLVDRFDGDARLALVAYHRGPSRLRRQLAQGTFEGSRYAATVLELYRALDSQRTRRLTGRG